MASPTPAEFYANKHLGTGFHVIDKAHPNPPGHSGQDVNGWSAGTRIPSFVEGTVAAKGYQPSNLGYWASVKFNYAGILLYAGYCHLRSASPLGVGDDIQVGSDIGPLGSTGYSEGNHLHGMVSSSPNLTLYRGLRDPLPYMVAARSGGGGGGGIPDPITVPEGHDNMETILCIISDGENRYGQGANAYFHCLWYPPTGKVTDISVQLGNQLATRFGLVGPDGEPVGAGANLTYADWEAIHGGSFKP